MPRLKTADLNAAVTLAVARSLGAAVDIPELADRRRATPDAAAEVVGAAAYHGVLPMLWAAVRRQDVPEAFSTATHDAFLPLVARSLRLTNLLRVVCDALTDARIDYAIFKGPAIARHYPTTDLRAYGDLDVLVRRNDVDAVDEAVRAAGLHGGWTGVPDNYAEAMYAMGSAPLDVHWHLMREAPMRGAFEIDTHAMLARSHRVVVQDVDVSVLDDVDLAIAVATHACFDGAYRLGWLVDLVQVMRSADFSWNELRARAAATHTSLPVQIVVDRAVAALRIAPPGEALVTGGWRRLMSRVSSARPIEHTYRQAGRGGIVFRATRATTPASMAALARLTIAEALVPLAKDPQHRWRTSREKRS